MIHFRKEGAVYQRGLNITTGRRWISFGWRSKDTIYRMRIKLFLTKSVTSYSETPEEVIVPRTENRNKLPPHWKRDE